MKLSRKILAAVLAAVALLSFMGCSQDNTAPDGFKNAANDACDFDFFVPLAWTVSLSDGTVAAYCSTVDASSISVMPGEVPNADTTVDDWWVSHKADLEKIYTDMSAVSVSDALLGDVAGKSYAFTAALAGNTYYFEITAVRALGRIYMMTFTSTPDLKDNHTETLASVKEYFRFH